MLRSTEHGIVEGAENPSLYMNYSYRAWVQVTRGNPFNNCLFRLLQILIMETSKNQLQPESWALPAEISDALNSAVLIPLNPEQHKWHR
jgi:hypothetical protein